MHAVAAIAASALALGAFVLPFSSRRRYARLMERLHSDPRARESDYRARIVRSWAVVGCIALVGALAGRSPRAVGLPAFDSGGVDGTLVVAVLALTLASLVPVLLLMRARGPERDRAWKCRLRPVIGLTPVSPRERVWFVLLCLTAGICEELMFRGFGIAYLRWLWPDASWAVLIVVTSVMFGAAHSYVGAAGTAFATSVGAVLGWVTLATGTLLPAMAVHTIVDLRNLAIPRPLVAQVAAEVDQAAPTGPTSR